MSSSLISETTLKSDSAGHHSINCPKVCSHGQVGQVVGLHAGDRGSNPLGSTTWLCGRTGRVAALSRRSLWDRDPPESPRMITCSFRQAKVLGN